MAFCNQIRERKAPEKARIARTLLILLLGIALGAFSKFLDCTPSNELPRSWNIWKFAIF